MNQEPRAEQEPRAAAPAEDGGSDSAQKAKALIGFGAVLALAGIVGGILAIPAIGVLAATPLVFGLAGAGLVLGLLSLWKGSGAVTVKSGDNDVSTGKAVYQETKIVANPRGVRLVGKGDPVLESDPGGVPRR